jgi:CRISPR system Cascade subunit CasC
MSKMKKSDRCYIDIHVLQTVPPSCVNRDDTGSPKSAVYGGVTRARVSSQAWKRAIRLYFGDHFDADSIGTRTKKLVGMIEDALLALDPKMPGKDARKKAEEALKAAGFSPKGDDGKVGALFFISKSQARSLAELAMKEVKEKEAYKAALKDTPAVDMALFGRMVADDPSLNYDAAAQVAHAISTHAVQNEFDYFTAVDDRAPEDNAGASHIGTTEYTSATLYRYATVNVNELASLIPEETTEAVKGFVEAFCCAMPTGKQSTFANRTVPDLVYVTIRNDQPVNFAGAFEKPVCAETGGYLAASELALAEYARKTYELFVPSPVLAFGCSRGDGLKELVEMLPLHTMIDRIGDYVEDRLKTGAAK